MTVLVTGGAGFIGSHLTRALLARGEKVVCLDNFNDYYSPSRKRANVAPFLDHPAYWLVEGDIRSAEILQEVFRCHRPQQVAHLAAMPGIALSLRDPLLYEQVNVSGTVQLLTTAVAYGVRTFLLASSSSVYGATSRVPFREDDHADRPLAPYAATKRAAELLAYTYHYLYGLGVIVPRFFNVYGPAGRPDMAPDIFVRAVHQGEPLHLRGNVRRDYTYIADIVAGVLSALDWSGGYEIVNLGNAHPVSMLEFICMVERVVGKAAKIEHLPPLPADAPVTYADTGKAYRLLGYEPATPLEDGLTHLYRWVLQQERAGIA